MRTEPDYLVAEFTPQRADARLARNRSRVIVGAISLAVSLIITGVIVYLNFEAMRALVAPWVILGAVLLVPIARLIVAIVAHRIARRDRDRVGVGAALVLGRSGVELEGARVPWAQVAELATRGRRWGNGPELAVRAEQGGTWSLPLDHIDALPASLDSAARIFSGGRRGIDLQGLDD